MKMNKKRGAVVVALTLATLLAACGSKSTGSSDTATSTYNYVYATDPDNFDYSITGRATNNDHLANFEDPLLKTDKYGQIVPGLAKSWKVSDDGKTYTYTLRKGVKWVDSEGNTYATVKAQDFITGLKHAVDGKSEALYIVQDSIKGLDDYVNGKTKDFSTVGIKAIGDNKIQYTLNQAEPYWNSKLQYGVLEPVNAKFLKQEGKKYGQPKADAILYTGPYILSNFTSKSVIEYKANDQYWDKKNVHVTDVKETYNDGSNPDELYKTFAKGDYTTARVYPNLPGYKDVEKKSKNNIVWSQQDASVYNFTFNLNRKSYNATSKTTDKQKADTKKAILNKDFRLAIQFAFDKANYNAQSTGSAGATKSLRNEITPPSFVQADGKDYGTYVESDLKDLDSSTFSKYNVADAQDGTYNAAKAKELFAKAKAELQKEGVAFPIKLDLPEESKAALLLNQAKSFKASVEKTLGKDNVEIDIQQLAEDKYLAGTYQAQTGAQSDFDISNASGWSPDYQDPSSYLDIFKPTSGAMAQTLGFVIGATGAQKTEYDAVAKETGLDQYEKLVDAAEAITTDTNARYKAFAKAEAYLLSLGVQIPVNSLGGTPSVTKVIPFTRPATWSGTPSPRFEGMKISKKAITTKAYDKAVKDWTAKRLELAKKND
ncbi:peptide ABC transporter substrate-binding protein [Lacticaseibacillus suibinensis]|uniref:peptide ABC transporter substrate-binding protein n=2 Tax=Lacticaseibacillus suibinensis TaxID=2486011 RepID=UPI00357170EA